jgi:hypothetical protein
MAWINKKLWIMAWINNNSRFTSASVVFVVFMLVITLASCSVSYTFNGASIDYAKVQSISIADFNNVAELVHPPLAQEFTEKLRDKYVKQTKLRLLKAGGDMHIEGEITGFELTPMSIGQDAYSAETKLTVTFNVRFTNKSNPQDDFIDKKYTVFRVFDSSRLLSDAQDEILPLMIEDVTDNIYNDTVAKW